MSTVDLTKRSNIEGLLGRRFALDIDGRPKVILRSSKAKRQRYSLMQVLEGVTEAIMLALNLQTGWAREGTSVGDELI